MTHLKAQKWHLTRCRTAWRSWLWIRICSGILRVLLVGLERSRGEVARCFPWKENGTAQPEGGEHWWRSSDICRHEFLFFSLKAVCLEEQASFWRLACSFNMKFKQQASNESGIVACNMMELHWSMRWCRVRGCVCRKGQNLGRAQGQFDVLVSTTIASQQIPQRSLKSVSTELFKTLWTSVNLFV